MLFKRCATGRAVGAEAKRAERNLEIVDENEEIGVGVNVVGTQRCQRGAAAVHEGRGFEVRTGRRPRAFRRARALGATEGGSCQCSATASARRKPALWRVAAYSGPGFPRPTTARRAYSSFLPLGFSSAPASGRLASGRRFAFRALHLRGPCG